MLSPSQLGFNGSLWNVFSSNKAETMTFTGEPTRETLAQPPTGYQTPSPDYAYGTGPKESLNKRIAMSCRAKRPAIEPRHCWRSAPSEPAGPRVASVARQGLRRDHA
ncbi:MAG: hypothetical protein MZV49_21040 [Rhodopseudomonas palustris]|nr:hypothetical protein [Rhodopseudomonas palustris]